VFRKCLNFRKTWLGIVVFLRFIRGMTVKTIAKTLASSGYAAHITVERTGGVADA
jgi:hypothetical protein